MNFQIIARVLGLISSILAGIVGGWMTGLSVFLALATIDLSLRAHSEKIEKSVERPTSVASNGSTSGQNQLAVEIFTAIQYNSHSAGLATEAVMAVLKKNQE